MFVSDDFYQKHDTVLDTLSDRVQLCQIKRAGCTMRALIENIEELNDIFKIAFDKVRNGPKKLDSFSSVFKCTVASVYAALASGFRL